MSVSSAQRHLLFGILALQNNFISREQLLAAFQAWIVDKDRSLGDILQEQQVLDGDVVTLLDALADKHLAFHGNDPSKSIAVAGANNPACDELARLADPDVLGSLPARSRIDRTSRDPNDPFATASSVGLASLAGTRFRILRPHLRGGLGEVFVAHDEELHREVALKQIRIEHAFHPENRARFLLEAEVTGRLEHPGIVPVYALGAYADGRPFYAMRFIKGESLKEAIESFHSADGGARKPTPVEQNLRLRQLLSRFIAVCQAVQYAHDCGILHRDLKPDNIMLGKYGETLVVDWGLAKARARKEAPGEENLLRLSTLPGNAETLPGAAMGTPAYMSPEQATGRLDQVDCASDIYSLGTTLFALLTGQAPFALGNVAEVLRKVERGEFPRPRRLKPDVAPGLEAICLKAMALKPADRYPAARALAAEVESWLADEPVAAFAEPWKARMGRFARRHARLVSGLAAALIVALIAAGIGALLYQNEKSLQAAEELKRQLVAAQKLETAQERVAQVLDHAEGERGKLHKLLVNETDLRDLLSQPERWLARLKILRNELEKAQALAADAGAELAVGLRERIEKLSRDLKRDDDDFTVANALEDIRVRKTILSHEKTASDYKKTFLTANLPVFAGLHNAKALAASIGASHIRAQLLAAVVDWGLVLTQEKERRAAHRVPMEDDWLTGQLFMVAQFGEDPHWLALWGQLKDKEAMLDFAEKTLDEDHALRNVPLRIIELVGHVLPMPTKERWFHAAHAQFPRDFWVNLELGKILRAQEKWPDAIGFYRAAAAIRPDSGLIYRNLGVALGRTKQLAAAAAAFEKSIVLEKDRTAKDHALALTNLGSALAELNELDEAVDALAKATTIDPKLREAWTGLGNVRRLQGKHGSAVTAYQECIALANELKVRPESELAQLHASLGRSFLDMGNFESALAHFKQCQDFKGQPEHVRDWLADCERRIDLENQLPAVLDGKPALLKGEAARLRDYLDLAALMRTRMRPGAAVKVIETAGQLYPETWQKIRYDAVRAASLAATADGKGDEFESKESLRGKALEWLRQELRELRELELPDLAIKVLDRLERWQAEEDLAGLRGKELKKLPAKERAAWDTFWTEADALAKEVTANCLKTEGPWEGRLHPGKRCVVYEVSLLAGHVYYIDMRSADVNSQVRILNAKREVVKESDDPIDRSRHARIKFEPTSSGTFRVEATSFWRRGGGDYTLTIRQLKK